ncbi:MULTISPECIES: putative bifunctional diguanylate cyclase/phosphodiesterase [Thalassospira]|uniref:Diguanylate cyclase n=2 Tax=Thalassospira TaxID=168934 RepID=A0A367W3E4_9PROT|nr:MULTISPECIES: EAL domain-containing protein [Thalassospira]MDG4720241.1 EAL domain-containing protein [Thalassospira sp. FZY0004]RCK33093.1 diguanylate cyclase [Thalassospira profundimaris]
MTVGKFGQRVADIFKIHTEKPELIRAQVKALSRQIPVLYMLLLANAVALAYTHYGVAPDWLTIYAVLVLATVCIVRAIAWSRATVDIDDFEACVGHLRRIRILAVTVAVLFTAWAITMFDYGDAYQQGHVAYFISITVVGCIFCLVNFPPAAMLVVVIVLGTFVLFFGFSANEVYVAIAVNMALVSVMIIQIIRSFYANFAGLIDSQLDLEEQHKTTIELSRQNEALALIDPLTGLSNRRAFFAFLEDTVSKSVPGTQFAVAMIDLDGFKPVNDVHGHPAGDELLVLAGERLRRILGPETLLARLGGDEFGVVLTEHSDAIELIDLGQSLCAALNRPFALSSISVQVSASLGFATFPNVARSSNGLFERADFALYHAKKNCPGEPVLFAAHHETLIRHDSQIEQALRKADLSSELTLFYQPVYDLGSGEVVSMEALARWDSVLMGRVSPGTFFPVAEKTGQVNFLTRVLFEKLLVDMADWPVSVAVSFNLSARDIILSDTVEWLIDQIKLHGIDPSRVTFEVTETAFLRDFAAARTSMRYLRTHGARIALDDFGIGYSSLRYVHELEFDVLKVDRSFVKPLPGNERSQRIVKTVIDMCANLGIDCILEGIETDQQRDVIIGLGGQLMQGYFFARPDREPQLAPLSDMLKS